MLRRGNRRRRSAGRGFYFALLRFTPHSQILAEVWEPLNCQFWPSTPLPSRKNKGSLVISESGPVRDLGDVARAALRKR
jgi:hypothetical protein